MLPNDFRFPRSLNISQYFQRLDESPITEGRD